jgi:hypothetical protein
MEKEPEVWLPVRGFEHKYHISNHGRLKSFSNKMKIKYPSGYITIGTKDTEGYRSHHLDGDKSNNYYKNLQCTTYLGNSNHAVSTGLFNIKGQKHPHSKLSEEDVIDMRRIRSKSGISYDAIGRMYGVCRRQASDVIRGVNWGWL